MVAEKWSERIAPFDTEAAGLAEKRWETVAKPLKSLGMLEDIVVHISGITGEYRYSLDKRGVLVLCGDNGVIRQGVTQTGSEITALVAKNLTIGITPVCVMAQIAGADIIPVDMGMVQEYDYEGLLKYRVAAGTQDISEGPAMSREQAEQAVDTGIELVRIAKNDGYKMLCTGEMGIGNTTTSSAVASVLLGCDPAEVTGRGAGLTTEGLRRKVEVIRKAIAVNKPDPDDALDVLAKLGGFDIAGLCGVFLGGAIHRIPIVADGLISTTAALAAKRICPNGGFATLASHTSAEPAGKMLLEALGLRPLINAGMFLGEGTGAVAALPLLDMGYAVYDKIPTFAEINMDDYVPLS